LPAAAGRVWLSAVAVVVVSESELEKMVPRNAEQSIRLGGERLHDRNSRRMGERREPLDAAELF
jgi:hypothetical protein